MLESLWSSGLRKTDQSETSVLPAALRTAVSVSGALLSCRPACLFPFLAGTLQISDRRLSLCLLPVGRDAPVLVGSGGGSVARPREPGRRGPAVHGGGPAGDPGQQQPEVRRQ